jgi:geranylgeranyl diphosphate synthase type II
MAHIKENPTITRYQHIIDRAIQTLKLGKKPATLYDPIRYIMQLGGKRLRPLLVMLSYSIFRNDVKKILPCALAVELFHNFTLMHDDIMDKAPLRRGKPTVHEKWDISTAILSGDVMLVKVYDLFLTLPPVQAVPVLRLFNACATQVCEGQQWDMEFEKINHVTEAQYLRMIRYKTAALLGFSAELGACLAGASPASCRSLNSFGINLGMGFQLMDDLLDAYGDPQKFGKQVGGDILSNKKTYLLISSLQKASPAQRAELEKWINATYFDPEEKISAVLTIWNELNIHQAAMKKVNACFKKAFAALEKVKGNTAAKALLHEYADSLIRRQH